MLTYQRKDFTIGLDVSQQAEVVANAGRIDANSGGHNGCFSSP